MKKIILVLICSLAANVVFSQTSRHTNKITRDKTGYVKEYETTDFAFSINSGTAINFYDKSTRTFTGNTQSVFFSTSLFYSDYFITFEYRPSIKFLTSQKGVLIFSNNSSIEGFFEANIVNSKFRLGHTYNFGNDFGIEPYAAYLLTNMYIYDDDVRKAINLKKGSGITAGFVINKYFKLKGFGNYFVVYLDNNINYSGMKQIHPALGNSFYSVEVGIAFKSWISRRKID